jgi:hypothetical protein
MAARSDRSGIRRHIARKRPDLPEDEHEDRDAERDRRGGRVQRRRSALGLSPVDLVALGFTGSFTA